eukprot:415301_1
MTVQIHELYAALWANEKIILQCIDVLRVLKSEPITIQRINREWRANTYKCRDLVHCLRSIIMKLLIEIQELVVRSSNEMLKYVIEDLLLVSDLFDHESIIYKYMDTESRVLLQKKWNVIRLSMNVYRINPIPAQFIKIVIDRRLDIFDDIQKLAEIMNRLAYVWDGSTNKNELLQLFLQEYIRLYTFRSETTNEFIHSIVHIAAEEKANEPDYMLPIEPNSFAKMEMVLQLLNRMSSDENKNVTEILSNVIENIALTDAVATLISRVQEQRLHNLMRKQHMGDFIVAPSKSKVLAANDKLNRSINSTKLSQILAISECKVVLYYFSRYLQAILEAKGQINKNGIWYKQQRVKKVKYLQAIGSLLRTPKNCSENMRYIKQGLQYYFVSEIWNMGAKKTTQLVTKPIFRNLLAVELFNDDLQDDATWAKIFSEQMDIHTDDGREFLENYQPNLFLPFRSLTLSAFKDIILKDKTNQKNYPVIWGIMSIIDTADGYSVFGLEYLPAMVTWMRLIKLHLNRRLKLQELLDKKDEYSSEWVIDQCKKNRWGDPEVWQNAFQGFVDGWNHVASRVTTNDNLKDVVIDSAEKKQEEQQEEKKQEEEDDEAE